MYYPMPDEWRQAAVRVLDDRAAEDAMRDARAHAMLDLLTQDALRRRGIMATVRRGTIEGRREDGGTIGPLDFENARAEAMREMTAKGEARTMREQDGGEIVGNDSAARIEADAEHVRQARLQAGEMPTYRAPNLTQEQADAHNAEASRHGYRVSVGT